ncbi:MAG: GNAT family N-acetyltransferase [Sphaerochaetaceae bacterium]|nr:GNAT family N-acetyltransferase [Sphaerochaetaceae bacterium]
METDLIILEDLSAQEIEYFNQIIDACNSYDETGYQFDSTDDFKVEGNPNYFLLFEQDDPVAAVYLFTPGTAEAEIYAFTLPAFRRKGYITRLLQSVQGELKRRGTPSILYVCDSRSSSGNAFLESRGLSIEFSEYLMLWRPPLIPLQETDVRLRACCERDTGKLAILQSSAFYDDIARAEQIVESFISSARRDVYAVVTPDDTVVGMIGRYLEEGRVYIHGFTMAEAVRGRGWGRQALTRMVELCYTEDPSRPIVLEVETRNAGALALYESCGFHLRSRFDYYRQGLKWIKLLR